MRGPKGSWPESVQTASRGRILFVTSNFPRWPGDSTTPFVLNLAQDLNELGWEVDVLAPHAPGAQGEEVLAGVRVSRFRYMWPEALQTVCYGGGALINLRDRPLNLLKVPFLVGSEFVRTLQRLRSRRYRLLHTHWILPQGFVGSLVAGWWGVPHVLTVHGGDIFALRSPILSPFKRFALQRADIVTVNSSATRSAVSRIAPDVKEMSLIPMGVDIHEDPPRGLAHSIRALFRRGQGPLLVFAGRLVSEKGVEDLIRAVALLVPSLPDVTVILLGEGQHRARMQAVAVELGLGDRIHFLGWVPSELVPPHLAAGDMFVAPSRRAPDGWVEAQGLGLIEAMSMGVPVIATETGGVVDTVREGETGLLVPEGSPAAIAATVRQLCQDRSLGKRLGRAGQELAVRQFGRREVALKFSRLFVDAIARHERSRRG